VPVDEAPGYGTTRATTRQTPPQAPLNRGSGPSGRCESDRLKRFGRGGPIEHAATPRHHRLAHPSRTGHIFRGVPRIEVFGLWRNQSDSRDRSMGLCQSAKASGLRPWSTVFRAFEVGTFLPVGACSTAVRSAISYDKKRDRPAATLSLSGSDAGSNPIVRCELSRLFGHQSGESLWRRWRSNR
jgi:hypothetical protein